MSLQDLIPFNPFSEDLYLWSVPIHIPEYSCIDTPWSLNTYTQFKALSRGKFPLRVTDDKNPSFSQCY